MNLKQTQQKINEKRMDVVRLCQEINELVRGLQGVCDHAETELYSWEHDSGYGVQTGMWGKRCVHCMFIDLWNRNHFISPKDIQ